MYSNTFDADFQRELADIEAESLGWLPLDENTYLHLSDENPTEVLVVGVPQAGAAVLLVDSFVADFMSLSEEDKTTVRAVVGVFGRAGIV